MECQLRSSIGDHLEAAVKLGTYRLPGFHAHRTQPANQPALQRPAPPTALKHTGPREKDLCLKQEVLTQWESVTDEEVAAEFKKMVQFHNTHFNASGVPLKSRRALEDRAEADIQHEPLRPREGQYPDAAALKARRTLRAH